MSRLDIFLTEKALVPSREAAKRRIVAGDVLVNGQVTRKPSYSVEEGDTIVLRGEDMPFVSRGGLKLEAALAAGPGLREIGGCWLDVGASTGGFTHCLLLHGASHVVALDVGTNQLHPSLREDARVTIMENTNAREMRPDWFAQTFQGAVMDVSFISVGKILPALHTVLGEGAYFITLIKPQFEAGKGVPNKHGIITDARVHRRVLEEVSACLGDNGFRIRALLPSPIAGQDGNREFLAVTLRGRVPLVPSQETIIRCLAGETVLFPLDTSCIKTE